MSSFLSFSIHIFSTRVILALSCVISGSINLYHLLLDCFVEIIKVIRKVIYLLADLDVLLLVQRLARMEVIIMIILKVDNTRIIRIFPRSSRTATRRKFLWTSIPTNICLNALPSARRGCSHIVSSTINSCLRQFLERSVIAGLQRLHQVSDNTFLHHILGTKFTHNVPNSTTICY